MMGTQVLLDAISVSTDGRWIVCGTTRGASVWDVQTQQKTVEVQDTNPVPTVDISPDSTKFATGTGSDASTWEILTGERSVGPLKHVGGVVGVKFSPNGDRFATAGRDSIHVFDSRNGNQLEAITVKPGISFWPRSTPLAWSNDGQQVFVLSIDYKIKSFKVSTGYKMAEARLRRTEMSGTVSMALAANGKFLATTAGKSLIFWDASTLKKIGRAIEDTKNVSMSLSPDCNYLVTGKSGSIIIRALSGILPDSYGPFQVSICGFTLLFPPSTSCPRHLLKGNLRQKRSRIHRSKNKNNLRHRALMTNQPPDSTPVRDYHVVTKRVLTLASLHKKTADDAKSD